MYTSGREILEAPKKENTYPLTNPFLKVSGITNQQVNDDISSCYR